ncbi:hypothetical protein [Alsobacter sp. R-9]
MTPEIVFLMRAALFAALVASMACYVVSRWGEGTGRDGFFR